MPETIKEQVLQANEKYHTAIDRFLNDRDVEVADKATVATLVDGVFKRMIAVNALLNKIYP